MSDVPAASPTPNSLTAEELQRLDGEYFQTEGEHKAAYTAIVRLRATIASDRERIKELEKRLTALEGNAPRGAEYNWATGEYDEVKP